MGPLAGGVVVLGLDVGQARPPDQDGASSLVLEDLGGVEVEAKVELDKPRLVDAGVGTVRVHEAGVLRHEVDEPAVEGDVARVVYVLEARRPLAHALRAHEEKLAPAERGEIGAFPHVAKGLPSEVGRGALESPAEAVGAFVEKDAAPIALSACAEQHVPAAALLPDLGVPHMAGAVGGVALIA